MPNSDCNRPNCEEEGPLSNISAEAPDAPVFVSTYFPPNDTPLGQSWTAESCHTTCVSTDSQEEALLCAARAAAACVVNPPPSNPPDDPPPDVEPPFFPPPTTPPPEPPEPPLSVTYHNEAQTATVECPDGSQFSYTVPAGTFFARSVALANAQALSFARRRAFQRMICISGDFNNACVDQPYSETVTATGGAVPITWTLTNALPTGMVMSQDSRNLLISGTPTTAGNFTFQLRATDAFGHFMDKVFTIAVIEISTASPLPTANVGSMYSVQLMVSGGTNPYIWTVAGGSLPGGLTLTEGGLLSGTPTTGGDFTFTVQLEDATGATCQKEFELMVSTGCVSNNDDPTPSSLITTDDVSFGILVYDGALGGIQPWTTPMPPGTYYANYLGGHVTYESGINNCIITGQSSNPLAPTVGLFDVSHSNTLIGYLCGSSCCTPGCAPLAESNTIAENPVTCNEIPINIWVDQPMELASNTAGQVNGPIIGAGVFGGGNPGGTISWEMIQQQGFLPQPERVRIRDYESSIKPSLVPDGGTCNPFDQTGGLTEWDGTLPERRLLYPSSSHVEWAPAGGFEISPTRFFSIHGYDMAYLTINFGTSVRFRSAAGVGWWELVIVFFDSVFIQALWVGKKFTGTDPVGTYDYVAAESCGLGPSSICIESY